MPENLHNSTALMPDGTPAPTVLLEEDLIRFLRLRELNLANPENTLRYYRDKNMLQATRIGNRVCYTLPAVMTFLETVTDGNHKRA